MTLDFLTFLEGFLEKGCTIEFIRGSFIGDIHQVDCETSRHAVVRQVVPEKSLVSFCVSFPQTLLFCSVSRWIDQWIWGFRLAAEGVNLDEIDILKGVANSGILKPFFPGFEYERYFLVGIHGHQLS